MKPKEENINELRNTLKQNYLSEYSDLLAVKSTLETLQSYSLWDRLCWSIKRIWEV